MSAYDCGQVSAFMQETCHDLLRDQDQMRSMAVYKRAKFESYLGPQVGFELATGRLTAQRLSSRKQTADRRLKSRKSEERTHAGSMITPQFMTFSIRYQVRLAQVKGFTQHAGRNGATHVSVHGNSALPKDLHFARICQYEADATLGTRQPKFR